MSPMSGRGRWTVEHDGRSVAVLLGAAAVIAIVLWWLLYKTPLPYIILGVLIAAVVVSLGVAAVVIPRELRSLRTQEPVRGAVRAAERPALPDVQSPAALPVRQRPAIVARRIVAGEIISSERLER